MLLRRMHTRETIITVQRDKRRGACGEIAVDKVNAFICTRRPTTIAAQWVAAQPARYCD